MHHKVHHTDVVPELAGRRGMSLVARSKGEKILQLYASRQSHVVEMRSPRAVVGEWSRQSLSTGRGASGEVQTMVREWCASPRAQVEKQTTKSPSVARDPFRRSVWSAMYGIIWSALTKLPGARAFRAVVMAAVAVVMACGRSDVVLTLVVGDSGSSRSAMV